MTYKDLEIIYEDKVLLVVRKPAGIAVQSSRAMEPDMVSLLRNYRGSKREDTYIGLVHRLDQPVEGVMMFAKTKDAAAKLSAQVAGREVDKHYLAVVYLESTNCTEADWDVQIESQEVKTLTDYLLCNGQSNTSSIVTGVTPEAKKAVLHYQMIKRNGKLALVSVKLETGRHHQIRVQMSHAGMPLVGDRKYAPKEALFIPGAGKDVALCSVEIGFTHPVTNKKMKYQIKPENRTFQLLECD